MPHANADLIRRLYAALAARDSAAMGACYTDDARFSDPVFRDLDAAGVRAMWAMLCARASDLAVSVTDIDADDRHAARAGSPPTLSARPGARCAT